MRHFLGPSNGATLTVMNRVINIWADVICPFCYLGSVWAEQAARELQADLRWLPFEIHPDTPPEGAPKPFSPEEWPQVRERLKRLAQEVGVPIDPPQHNVNSRFALETAELVRAQKGDGEAGAFCHHVSRAFFTEHEGAPPPSPPVQYPAGSPPPPAPKVKIGGREKTAAC